MYGYEEIALDIGLRKLYLCSVTLNH